MSVVEKILVTLAAVLGVAAGSACGFEPPDYWGRYWCFDAVGATGREVVSSATKSIHRDGDPVRTCFCFCDQLHADSLLFTGDDPPEPSDDWLGTIEFKRDVAVQDCREAAIELGLIDDNCDEVTPPFPTWTYQDKTCAGGFETKLPYCTDPENADGETGSEDTGPS